jgi:hypothetical protein
MLQRQRDLPIEFVPQALTSYGGLELLRRYLQRVDLPGRLRWTLATLGSDYGSARLSLLVLALLCVGGRRPEHLRYVAGDLLVRRFCGLARVPTARTVGNWLRQFSRTTLAALSRLNHEVVTDAISRLELPRLTIDVDGTVVRSGATVGWAFLACWACPRARDRRQANRTRFWRRIGWLATLTGLAAMKRIERRPRSRRCRLTMSPGHDAVHVYEIGDRAPASAARRNLIMPGGRPHAPRRSARPSRPRGSAPLSRRPRWA